MKILVQKFGGTSVKNISCLNNVADIIINKYNKGYKVVVVVSAQDKITDNLISKAEETGIDYNCAERDILLSTGELQAMALLAMCIKQKGYKNVICLSGGQAGIITDNNYGNAKIISIYKDNIISHLKKGEIVIVAGFQGLDKMGNTTTLGRGGSDLTAVSLASVLNAIRCDIYTDVDGIYTSDPNKIINSRLLRNISYDEMLELSTAGARVMHNRAVKIGKKYNVKINVKSSMKDNIGTKIFNKEEKKDNEDKNNIEKNEITAITKKDNICKITIVGYGLIDNKDIFKDVVNILNVNNINIYMISMSEISISLIIDKEMSDEVVKVIHNHFIK